MCVDAFSSHASGDLLTFADETDGSISYLHCGKQLEFYSCLVACPNGDMRSQLVNELEETTVSLCLSFTGFSGKLEQAQSKFVTSEEVCDRYYELTPVGFCRFAACTIAKDEQALEASDNLRVRRYLLAISKANLVYQYTAMFDQPMPDA
ncbi:hypothetical protein AAVH_12873 [Aphelenchoides avenae]|nr:hypothetical protein AAVH_12873 [Aphelenchus avenae]